MRWRRPRHASPPRHATAIAPARSEDRSRSGPRAARWYRETPLRPPVALVLDDRRDIDARALIRRNGRPGDAPAADLHQPRAGGHPLQPDPDVLFGDLDFGARPEACPLPDGRRNHHPASLINGRSHGNTIPSYWRTSVRTTEICAAG